MIISNNYSALTEARKFVNPKLGIIKFCVSRKRIWGEDNYFQYACELAKMGRIINMPHFPVSSTSASMDKTQAEIGAIVEGLERYCGVMKYFEDVPIYTSESENIENNLFPVKELPICLDEEYSNFYNFLSKPNSNQSYYWTKCRDLINDNDIYVPSSYIFLNHNINQKNEIISTPNSTGTAGGQLLEKATVNAILEALERDAIMITWLNQIPRNKIDIDTIKNKDILKRINAHKRNKSEVFLFDISTDFDIPIVLCVIKSPEYPEITVTAAAKLNSDEAVCRALDEAFTTRNFGLYNKSKFYIKNYDDKFHNVIDFEDHYYLYNKPKMQNKLDFLIKNDKTIHINELANNEKLEHYESQEVLEYFIDEFKKRSFHLISKEITTSDISHSIFRFVKIFTPNLVVLSPNHNLRFLKNNRIKDILPQIGYSDYSNKKITNLPHPFA
ncbi:MAG: hypothetical protein CVV23_05400 [Ignavibacteriae bacterium HGW-Ignavibacteriae-2]|jgi:ribosomal protein S12 methylthiotransferase accessory factor|nr:MAG: hypothetical protein CVV23_05400 [Ignavibacteriae bacterium HGW-Ignavibacteriae-2]